MFRRRTLTITYTATPISQSYGSGAATLTGTVSATGLVNGQTLASATTGGVNWTTTAPANANAGSYAVTGSGLIAVNGNYSITSVQAAGNATALTITPANATITYYATQVYKTYGNANPTFVGVEAATGLVNGDSISTVTNGTAVFSSTATNLTGVGSYAVTGSGLTAKNGNYNLTFAQAPQNATALLISARLLTLQANPITIAAGSAIPTSDTVTDTWDSANTGLVNGDTVSSETVTSNATTSSPPGGYALFGSNPVFSHGSASNYTITYQVNQWGLTIH